MIDSAERAAGDDKGNNQEQSPLAASFDRHSDNTPLPVRGVSGELDHSAQFCLRAVGVGRFRDSRGQPPYRALRYPFGWFQAFGIASVRANPEGNRPSARI